MLLLHARSRPRRRARRSRAAARSRPARSSPSRPPRRRRRSGSASSVSGTPTWLFRLPVVACTSRRAAERGAHQFLGARLAVGPADGDHRPRPRAAADSARARRARAACRAPRRRARREPAAALRPASMHDTSAAAPLATASARKSCASKRSPRSATNRSPGWMRARVGGHARAVGRSSCTGRQPEGRADTRRSVQNARVGALTALHCACAASSSRTMLLLVERVAGRRRAPGTSRGPCRRAARRRSPDRRARARARSPRAGPRCARGWPGGSAALDVVEDRARDPRCADCRSSRSRRRRCARRRWPISGRLPRSRSPPQPNTTISAPRRERAQRVERALERVRRVRVVAQHGRAFARASRGVPAPAACAPAARRSSPTVDARARTPRPPRRARWPR